MKAANATSIVAITGTALAVAALKRDAHVAVPSTPRSADMKKFALKKVSKRTQTLGWVIHRRPVQYLYKLHHEGRSRLASVAEESSCAPLLKLLPSLPKPSQRRHMHNAKLSLGA
ncbi:hypothetical protein EI94DRAFT_1798935 [Lactarius quietus]|nr:hypothetical protein EI94DRAFT_1821386 [Lactarius quietus]KAF8269649.1 hypothetical protein EI94DRAFT_1798935 [Lactarius quietus]